MEACGAKAEGPVETGENELAADEAEAEAEAGGSWVRSEGTSSGAREGDGIEPITSLGVGLDGETGKPDTSAREREARRAEPVGYASASSGDKGSVACFAYIRDLREERVN